MPCSLVGPAVFVLAACSSSGNKSNAAASTLPAEFCPDRRADRDRDRDGHADELPLRTPALPHLAVVLEYPNAGGGAAGHIVGYVEFTNIGGVTCRMYGYPGLGLVNSSGQTIPITVTRGGGMGEEASATPGSVTLAPNAVATCRVRLHRRPEGGQPARLRRNCRSRRRTRPTSC